VKTLYIDIETAPALAYIWDLRTRYVPLERVVEDGYVLCFSARWSGSDEVEFWSRWDHGEKTMVKAAWKLLDEADAVIHYHGNGFDIPRLNVEFLKYRLGPPSPSWQIDLYQTVRRKFKVLSRSMKHMLDTLGLESKMEHKGMALWTGCMNGNEEDQQIMEDYNVQDVIVMHDLYMELRPWITTHPNAALFMEPEENGKLRCRCGSTNLRFKGYKHTKVLSYKQYHCRDCGFYPRERYADNSGKNRRKDVLTW
jgi:hypothetical protein